VQHVAEKKNKFISHEKSGSDVYVLLIEPLGKNYKLRSTLKIHKRNYFIILFCIWNGECRWWWRRSHYNFSDRLIWLACKSKFSGFFFSWKFLFCSKNFLQVFLLNLRILYFNKNFKFLLFEREFHTYVPLHIIASHMWCYHRYIRHMGDE